uniref:Major facilitator superfamily (MFS) profile domain-containing protein n=1 Tax=Aureoumbra lagunensis TaxID=44058 RepID=A0A7S3JXP8_9STRA|mmetsp:Transcript_11280/g.15479  ORF Transcript_11280/g.15479 Transcript_11280/m.15479 type:complete len:463 (+) Transcript_11280:67-1455(+)
MTTAEEQITLKMQAWVYLVTWVQYAMNHVTRKCYTNVKNIFISKGLSKMVLGRMDAGFMFTYAFGAPLAGQLGDMFNPSKVLGLGLLGSALCIFSLAYGVWNNFGALAAWEVNGYFLGVYLVFGFFQAIGGPVGTSIMGNWMVTPGARANRGLIYGTWTTHQYFGNILAPFIIIGCNYYHAKWWWGLMWPVILNAFWGLICIAFLPPSPESLALAKRNAQAKASGNVQEAIPEQKALISIGRALQIPSVPGYCIAFGFMKTINYVLFFWLPLFLQTHFPSDTANLISTLYDFGMMPGGIIVGLVSDALGGRRGCVVVVFLIILCPLLLIMALFADALGTGQLMIILACMGILIGGPNNIVTSAVAADLAEHPSIRGNKAALGTVVGLINGSGSFVAALGQIAVPYITDALGWPALWYFMLIATIISCILMLPKIYSELFGVDAPIATAKPGYAAVASAESKA